MQCNFVHKYDHWGKTLEVIWEDKKGHRLPCDWAVFKKCAHFLTETIDGIVWHTAGFANVTAHKNALPGILVYSEGGDARISTQGISWYQSQEESYAALKRAFLVSYWAAMQNRTVSYYDPFDSNTHAHQQERNPSKAYSDSWLNKNDCLRLHERKGELNQSGRKVHQYAHNESRYGYSDNGDQHCKSEKDRDQPHSLRHTSCPSQKAWCYSDTDSGGRWLLSQNEQSSEYSHHHQQHPSYTSYAGQPGSKRPRNSEIQHS